MSYLADYRHSAGVRKLLSSLVPVTCPPIAVELDLVDDIVDHVELTMRASSALVRRALVVGIHGYELAAMAFPSHRGRRASQLSVPQATRYFESWFSSALPPQHEFAKGIRSLLCLACYEQPAVMKSLGYQPQVWVDRSKRYRLETYEDNIAKHRASLFAPDPLPGVLPRHADARKAAQ